MRKFTAMFFALSLLTFGVEAARANLLTNPDLDETAVSTQIGATPVDWVAAASRSATGVFDDGLSAEGFANVSQPAGDCGGSGCGVFFKPFQGTLANPNAMPPVELNRLYVIFSQTFAAAPGNIFRLTGFAGAGAGYIGLTDPTVMSQFALEFLDGANAVLASTVIDLVPLGLGTPNGNPFGYAQYTVTAGPAPAGTVAVRSLAQMLNAYGNPAGGDQAFVVDSFDLILVPEPATASLVGLALVGLMGIRQRSR